MQEKKHLPRTELVIFNLITSTLAWGWPILLSFVITPFVVRGLGNDAFGIRGLVISITGYFALLDMGLNGAVTKFMAEYQAQNNKPLMTELLGTTLTTFIVFGLLGGTLIWALAKWFASHLFNIPPEFQNEAIWAFRLSGIGFLLSMVTWWASSIPSGLQRFDVLNGISIGFGTITSLSTIAAVLMGYGLIGVVLANLLSNVIAIIAYWVANRKLLPDIVIHFSFDRIMFKRTVFFGLYMVGFRMFGLIFGQLDNMLIGVWIGTAAITFYTIPQQIAQMIHGISGKLMQIIFPMASELSAIGDRHNLERMFFRGFNLTSVVGLSVAVPLAVVGEPLLHYWMSPEIAKQSIIVLELLIVGFFLYGFTALTTSYLGGINFPQLVMYGSIVSGVSGLILYVLLIKPFGVNGAAFGKMVSMALTLIYYIAMCSWRSGISVTSVLKILIRPMGIGVLIGSLSYFLAVPFISSLFGVILVAFLTAIVFISVCWILGVFDKNEKNSLIQVISRFISVVRSIKF
jgi:O-antigen/teichoic acid export membrane protein